jgi:AcrR family transcriptional regulator
MSARAPGRSKRARTPRADKPKSRTRRSAEVARARILAAAERELMRVGPEGLRLTELARELRVSHPAILHHFGSREGLVAAVVQQAMRSLSADLLEAITAAGDAPDRDRLLDMAAKVCSEGGFARLSAWLVLSDRADWAPPVKDTPIRQLAQTAHELRKRRDPASSYEDTLFEFQLVAIALLGDALFGEAVRRASGVSETPEASRAFRRRLARLLPDH